MKKAGLYDKNRYPYNARLLQSAGPGANTSFESRGNDVTLGSGARTHPNVARASRPRYAASADSRSHNGSDRFSDMDGFSDTASKRSHSTSKPRSMAAPLGTGYTDRSFAAMSVWSTNDGLIGDDDDLQPTVRIVTKFAVTALVLQIFCILFNFIVFFSPGWGRAKTDLREDKQYQGIVFSYYGLWLHCTVQRYEEYWSDLECRNSVIISFEAWWTICQVFTVVFTALSIIVFIMICFYVCRRKSRRRWPLAVSISVVAFVNCLFMTCVVVLFAIKFLDDEWWCCPSDNQVIDAILFWCWYLALTSLVCQIVSFIMMLVESVNLRK